MYLSQMIGFFLHNLGFFNIIYMYIAETLDRVFVCQKFMYLFPNDIVSLARCMHVCIVLCNENPNLFHSHKSNVSTYISLSPGSPLCAE